ncbi:elastin-like [Oncorhynchus tshawytscha]|uniref:Secretory calcium-binding phosphoprotein 9 n=1 Tax=Oncorhynchus tshawytscha TaxID=74940 RepID=A0A8C8FRD6_ONCTS|nr:elastin-like [Oncorhynchus tshawytscha]
MFKCQRATENTAWRTAPEAKQFSPLQDCKMKLLIFLAFMVTIFNVNAGKKLRLLAGLNGGVVSGVNPGLVVGGLNPGVLPGGTGLIGQPQFAQMVPGVPTYVMQPQAVPNGPYGFPNVGMLQPQLFPNFPGQYQYPAPPANGLPYYMGVPQMAGMNPPQQQVMGVQGAGGIPMMQQQQPQQGPSQAELVRRFKRFLMRRK